MGRSGEWGRSGRRPDKQKMSLKSLPLLLGAAALLLLGVGLGRWTAPRVVSAHPAPAPAPGIENAASGIESTAAGDLALDAEGKTVAAELETSPLPTREVTASDFRVLRVIDGDTLQVRYDGDITSVRLLDINAPERGDPRAEAATNELRRLVLDRVVRLDFAAARRRDNFGRLLCRVWIDEIDAGQHLLDQGFVEPYRPGPRKSNAE